MPAFFMSGLSRWSPSCLGLHTGWFGRRRRRLLGSLLRQWRQGNVAAVFVFGVAVQDQQHVDVAAVAGERIVDALGIDEVAARLGHRKPVVDRSEGRRVGKECVSTCRSRCWLYN